MRYERKYKVEDFSLDLVRQVIRNHPASFRKTYPDRQVNNIYFDTPDYQTYKDNVMGIAHRRKFRVRWYGDQNNTHQKNTLEIKIKENDLGRKESQTFPAFVLPHYQSLNSEVNKLLGNITALNAVLMNAYQRSYFATSNGQFRITIDHQLQYLPLVNAGESLRYSWTDAAIIVELKYAAGLEKAAQQIKQYLPFRQTKSSKYVTGLDWVLS